MPNPTLQIAMRIDKCYDEVLSFVEERGMSGWCVREVAGADNEHWHWYLETDGFKNLQAMRVALTRKVPDLKGNGAYSIKSCDENVERYWQYMAKGEANGEGVLPCWRHGLLWTDEKLEELHAAYWSENQVRKRQKLRPIDEVVLEKAKEAGVAWDRPYELQKIYIKELFARLKPINMYSVRSHCNLIALQLAPDVSEAVDKLVEHGGLL